MESVKRKAETGRYDEQLVGRIFPHKSYKEKKKRRQKYKEQA